MLIARFLHKYKEWFTFDYKQGEYIPKEGAPEEAIKLYEEYLENKKWLAENGYH